MSVPAYKIETPKLVGSFASTAKAFTGTSGKVLIPEPLMLVNTGVVFKLVTFQTCDCEAAVPPA
jgi:hypothetical protein